MRPHGCPGGLSLTASGAAITGCEGMQRVFHKKCIFVEKPVRSAERAGAAEAVFAVDRHDDAKADHHGHHSRPPEREERERDADDGGEAHHHRDVDGDIEEDGHRQAGRGEAVEFAFSALPHGQTPARHIDERGNEQYAADQAPFFGHRRKDEIGMAFGQIIEMAL